MTKLNFEIIYPVNAKFPTRIKLLDNKDKVYKIAKEFLKSEMESLFENYTVFSNIFGERMGEKYEKIYNLYYKRGIPKEKIEYLAGFITEIKGWDEMDKNDLYQISYHMIINITKDIIFELFEEVI